MRITSFVRGAAIAAACAVASATAAGAQSTGPLTLQPITSSIVFAPDVKVTTIDDKTGVLAGAYVGRLIENRVLVAAAAYGLTQPRDDARMFYGGLLFGTRIVGSDRVDVSARALAGFGTATAYRVVEFTADRPPHGRWSGPSPLASGGATFRVGYRDRFALVEPELRLALRLTGALSVNLGAGYRVTSADGWLNEAFRGPTGAVGVQFEIGR
ncbi:MAG: hypothetical protein IT184_18015 [Acidobacteria bacterium]|nr:hypothetical protein [Acidobacteriota bacterium]